MAIPRKKPSGQQFILLYPDNIASHPFNEM
jgi:hypothetical protein